MYFLVPLLLVLCVLGAPHIAERARSNVAKLKFNNRDVPSDTCPTVASTSTLYQGTSTVSVYPTVYLDFTGGLQETITSTIYQCSAPSSILDFCSMTSAFSIAAAATSSTFGSSTALDSSSQIAASSSTTDSSSVSTTSDQAASSSASASKSAAFSSSILSTSATTSSDQGAQTSSSAVLPRPQHKIPMQPRQLLHPQLLKPQTLTSRLRPPNFQLPALLIQAPRWQALHSLPNHQREQHCPAAPLTLQQAAPAQATLLPPPPRPPRRILLARAVLQLAAQPTISTAKKQPQTGSPKEATPPIEENIKPKVKKGKTMNWGDKGMYSTHRATVRAGKTIQPGRVKQDYIRTALNECCLVCIGRETEDIAQIEALVNEARAGRSNSSRRYGKLVDSNAPPPSVHSENDEEIDDDDK
ncbi:hypothetical protein BDZ45DRAFT_741783 [Acephala macrosclerotiorum]|nr:hypothetical protein BDZ45DRAFT_741783 [Acephala macrosclerotiorum]